MDSSSSSGSDCDEEQERIAELFSAIRKGKIQKVNTFLKSGYSVNAIDKNNKSNTPLHCAVHKCKKDIVERLLQEKNINVNVRNANHNTPLHIAANDGDRDLVQLLLNKNADIYLKNLKQKTPFHLALDSDHEEIVMQMAFKPCNVPQDTSSSLWAFALACLTSVKFNKSKFQQRFEQLFDTHHSVHVDHIRDVLQNPSLFATISETDDGVLKMLVTEIFRNRLIDKLVDNNQHKGDLLNISDILATRNESLIKKFLKDLSNQYENELCQYGVDTVKLLSDFKQDSDIEMKKLFTFKIEDSNFNTFIFDRFIECVRHPNSYCDQNALLAFIPHLIVSDFKPLDETGQNDTADGADKFNQFDLISHSQFGVFRVPVLFDAFKRNSLHHLQSRPFIIFDDVNWEDPNHWTLLHLTAHLDLSNLAQKLLDQGADIAMKTTDGQTALDIARNLENNNVLQILNSCEGIEKLNAETSHTDVNRTVEKPHLGLKTNDSHHQATGMRATYPGTDYQLKLLMLFAWRAKGKYDFKLTTEEAGVGKFDDLVFRYRKDDINQYSYKLIQAKHTLDENKCVTEKDLFPPPNSTSQFDLHKYFESYRDCVCQNAEFQNGCIENIVIITNRDLDTELRKYLVEMNIHKNDVLNFATEAKEQSRKPACWKFCQNNNELYVSRLLHTYNFFKLIALIGEALLSGKRSDMKDLLKNFNTQFIDSVIDVEAKRFRFKIIQDTEVALRSPVFSYFKKSFFTELFRNKKLLNISDLVDKLSRGISQCKSDNVVNFLKDQSIPKGYFNKLAGFILVESNGKIHFSKQFWMLPDADLPHFTYVEFRNMLRKQLVIHKVLSDEESKEIITGRLTKYAFKIANFATCSEVFIDDFWKALETCEILNNDSNCGSNSVSSTQPQTWELSVMMNEIKDFFQKLILAVNYSRQKLNDFIRKEISDEFGLIESDLVANAFQMEMSKLLDANDMRDNYISNNQSANQFFRSLRKKFSEFMLKGNSLEYCEVIKETNVTFKNDSVKKLNLKSLVSEKCDKQVIHFVSKHPNLTAIKIYQGLDRVFGCSPEERFLFMPLKSVVNLKDQVNDTFSSGVNLLIIECDRNVDGFEGVYKILSKVLRLYSQKKLILLTENDDQLANKLQMKFPSKFIQTTDGSINFDDLTVESQDLIVNQAVVKFQGKEIALRKLLPIASDTLQSILDSDIVFKFAKKEILEIGELLPDLGEINDYYIQRTFLQEAVIDFMKMRNYSTFHFMSSVENLEFQHQNVVVPIFGPCNSCDEQPKSDNNAPSEPDDRPPCLSKYTPINVCGHSSESNNAKLNNDHCILHSNNGERTNIKMNVDRRSHFSYNDIQARIDFQTLVTNAKVGKGEECMQMFRRDYECQRSIYELQKWFEHLQNSKLDVSRDNEDIVIISDSQDDFLKVCDLFVNRNLHWMKIVSHQLIWQKSYGSLTNIRYFLVQEEQHICQPQDCSDLCDDVILIVTEAGMGKSTLLTYLANKTKENCPSLWIVRMNLCEYSREFRNWSTQSPDYLSVFKLFYNHSAKEKLDLLDNCIKFEDVGNKISIYYDKDKQISSRMLLEISIFTYLFNEGKIVILLDGFDEILPCYKSEAHHFLQILKSMNKRSLWITSRPYGVKYELENDLCTLSYALQPLGLENQKLFFDQFWKSQLDQVKYQNHHDDDHRIELQDLIRKFMKHFCYLQNSILDTPLHLTMIGKIYRNSFEKYFELTKIDPNVELNIDFEEEMHILKLYDQFIKIKFEEVRFHEKQPGMNFYSPDMQNYVQQQFRECQESHQKLALYALFESDVLSELLTEPELEGILESEESLIEKIRRGSEKNGIIDKVIEDRPIFVHQTFAEYFAAMWFFNHKSKANVVQFLRTHIYKDDRKGIFHFLDHFLADKDSGIHIAVITNNVNRVKDLLHRNNQVVHSCDGLQRNPLHLAAAYGHSDIVKELLQYDNDVNVPDKLFRLTALNYADIANNWLMCEILLQHGANENDMLEAIDIAHYVFHIAAQYGYLKIAESLYRINPDDDCCACQQTILHHAAQHGHLEMIHLFVEHQADLNAVDMDYETPIHRAILYGQVEVVNYLCSRGALLDVDDNPRNRSNLQKALCLAFASGNLDMVNCFLDVIPDLNMKLEGGATALHLAAQMCQLDLIKFLIANGADINIGDDKQNTPLHRMVSMGLLNLEGFLARHDIDINYNDTVDIDQLQAYLFIASHIYFSMDYNYTNKFWKDFGVFNVAGGLGEQLSLMYMALGHPYNFRASAFNHWSPDLTFTFEKRKFDWEANIVNYLIFKGANMNCKNAAQNTPLMLAAQLGKLGVVKSLVSYHAEIDDRNVDGETALDLAIRYRRRHVVDYLLNIHADMN